MFSNYTFLNPSSEANHHHHQQLPFSSTFLHHQDPPQPLEQFLQLQPVSQNSDGQQTPIDVVVSRSRSMRSPPTVVSRRPVKKDRHSKIHTAQGVRDRRVRLSIGIARRFFDLQDMLGFDKASKTLEWLLGNSRNAIKNLGRRTITAPLSSSSSSSSGDLEAAKKMKRAGNDLDALARESRAKARARARERTLEKLTSGASSSQLKTNDISQNYLSACNSKPSTLKDQEVPIADSGNTSSPVQDQQNSVIAREGSYFNNFDYYCPNLPSSWDINSAINVYLCSEAAIHGKKHEKYLIASNTSNI